MDYSVFRVDDGDKITVDSVLQRLRIVWKSAVLYIVKACISWTVR